MKNSLYKDEYFFGDELQNIMASPVVSLPCAFGTLFNKLRAVELLASRIKPEARSW